MILLLWNIGEYCRQTNLSPETTHGAFDYTLLFLPLNLVNGPDGVGVFSRAYTHTAAGHLYSSYYLYVLVTLHLYTLTDGMYLNHPQPS